MPKTAVEKPAKVKRPSVNAVKNRAKPKSLLSAVTEQPEAKARKSKTTTADIKAPATPTVSKKRKATHDDDDSASHEVREKKSSSKTRKARAKVVEEEQKDIEKGEVTAVKNVGKKGSARPGSPKAKKKSLEEKEDIGVEPEAVEQEEEEGVQFFGFSTDDDDSSDEELDVEPEAADVTKLPTVAKDDTIVKRKLEKAKRNPTADRGVIYLGRIPHGFYEAQMRSYFSQFGDVTRLRLSRNKKTGRSKHYAFIEFESSSVAQIVAETMDNYLLMGHILTCKVIPKDEVHPELWVGANRKWRPVPSGRIVRSQHNRPRTEEEQEKAENRLIKRQEQKKRKLAEAGISYNFDAIAYKKRSKPAES